MQMTPNWLLMYLAPDETPAPEDSSMTFELEAPSGPQARLRQRLLSRQPLASTLQQACKQAHAHRGFGR